MGRLVSLRVVVAREGDAAFAPVHGKRDQEMSGTSVAEALPERKLLGSRIAASVAVAEFQGMACISMEAAGRGLALVAESRCSLAIRGDCLESTPAMAAVAYRDAVARSLYP